MRTAEWTGSVSVLDRVTAVLDAFGDDDGLGVSEIARRANLPKSTVSRIVTDLVRQRYLDRQGTRLHLGLKLFELGQAVERPTRLRRLAHPIMLQLRDLTAASVRLAVLDGPDVVLIASVSSRTDSAKDPGTGTRTPANTSALGRAILAHASLDVVHAATTAAGPTLRRALLDIRRAGCAVDENPSTGVVCVAGAILAASGPPIGAIAVSGSALDIDARRVSGLVRSAASVLGRQWANRPEA